MVEIIKQGLTEEEREQRYKEKKERAENYKYRFECHCCECVFTVTMKDILDKYGMNFLNKLHKEIERSYEAYPSFRKIINIDEEFTFCGCPNCGQLIVRNLTEEEKEIVHFMRWNVN